jgi:hypothetical protein
MTPDDAVAALAADSELTPVVHRLAPDTSNACLDGRPRRRFTLALDKSAYTSALVSGGQAGVLPR